MTGFIFAGILRVLIQFANTTPVSCRVLLASMMLVCLNSGPCLGRYLRAQQQPNRPLGRKQAVSIPFANPMRESLIGEVRILPLQSWRVTPTKQPWKMLGGQDTSVSFDIVLSNTAIIGEYEIPIQFALDANPPETVTVYRKVRVGPKGIEMKFETRLLPNGDQRVELVVITTTTEPHSCNCLLFPPAGVFVQRQVVVPAGEEVHRRIDFRDGVSMIGRRLRVRAVEQKQQRVMNYEVEINR